MTKEISLSHAERLEISKILNQAKFKHLSDMAFALEDAKAIDHTPEEVTKIDLKAINEGKSLSWTDDGEQKTIKLSDLTIETVLADIKTREAAGELTLADQNLITLQNKLK